MPFLLFNNDKLQHLLLFQSKKKDCGFFFSSAKNDKLLRSFHRERSRVGPSAASEPQFADTRVQFCDCADTRSYANSFLGGKTSPIFLRFQCFFFFCSSFINNLVVMRL